MKLSHVLPRYLRAASKRKLRDLIGLRTTGRAAFSQEGEDLVISKLLGVEEGRNPGFYVDVGAHDPERYSNTLFFYQRGWRGINIDPAPGSAAKFRTARERDISLELAISDTQGEIDYITFNEPALNGCDPQLASLRDGKNGHKIKGTGKVPAKRLDAVLDAHLPAKTQIDFLSVDVEGHDLAVLRSNAWDRYRPLIVLAEDASVFTLSEVAEAPITHYMRGMGYLPVSKCALTIVFADEGRIRRTELGIRVA